MNRFPFTPHFFFYGIIKPFSVKHLLQQITLLTLLGEGLLMAPVHANESPITIVDTWVEDGFLFHIELEAQPSNASCALSGEGLIEFEVAYDAQTSSGVDSVFGVATWYLGSDTNDRIETTGQAVGPQALCTTYSPCRIQEVHIVKAWGPLLSWQYLRLNASARQTFRGHQLPVFSLDG